MKPVVNITVGGQKKPSNYTYKTVILKSNLPFGSQVGEPNCIYVIKWDYNLGGSEVTIPENCVLKFEGGSLNNGTVIGNDTVIDAGLVQIFKDNLSFGGFFRIGSAMPEWFGAKADGYTDCTGAFNRTFDFTAYIRHFKKAHRADKTDVSVELNGGDYNISDTITVKNNLSFNIHGNGSSINYVKKEDVTPTCLLHIDSVQHGSGYPFNGDISNIVFRGNGYDVHGIVIGFAYGSILSDINIMDCIGWGIRLDSGGQVVFQNITINMIVWASLEQCYRNSDKLKQNDYTDFGGIYARNVFDCSACNIFTEFIPVGMVVGSSWRLYNIHSWGAAKTFSYNGEDIITYFTNLSLAIECGSDNYLYGCYADTCLMQDASMEDEETIVDGETHITDKHLVMVNGIYNGGIGVLVNGTKNVIVGLQAYVNGLIVTKDFLIAEDNYLVYLQDGSWNNYLIALYAPSQYYNHGAVGGGNNIRGFGNTLLGTGVAADKISANGSRAINDVLELNKVLYGTNEGKTTATVGRNVGNEHSNLDTARFIDYANGTSCLEIETNFPQDENQDENFIQQRIFLGYEDNKYGIYIGSDGQGTFNSPTRFIHDIWLKDGRTDLGPLDRSLKIEYTDVVPEHEGDETYNLVAYDTVNQRKRYIRFDSGEPANKSGLYADKPQADFKVIGQMYFATDLGKPVFWSGDVTKGDAGWVDANGESPMTNNG